jgi:hypothetical protein
MPETTATSSVPHTDDQSACFDRGYSAVRQFTETQDLKKATKDWSTKELNSAAEEAKTAMTLHNRGTGEWKKVHSQMLDLKSFTVLNKPTVSKKVSSAASTGHRR